MRLPDRGDSPQPPLPASAEQDAQMAFEAWAAILKMEADSPTLEHNAVFMAIRADMELVWLTAFAKITGQSVMDLTVPHNLRAEMSRLGLLRE